MELSFSKFNHITHLPGQRDLFRECFPETIGKAIETDGHYYWKFHSFPSGVKSFEYAAWDGEEMLGYYAAIPYRYRCGESQHTAGMVCDVMTGINARGKGVFTKLGFYSTDALKNEGIDFVTGYPIRPEVIPGHLKVNWKITFTMPVYIRFLRTNTVMKKYGMAFLTPLGNLGANFYNFLTANEKNDKKYDFKVFDKEEFFALEGYDRFFDRWQLTVENPLQKNREFMKWRLGAPETEYQIITATKNSELVGLAITRESVMENIPVLAILDMMVLPGHEKCIPGINLMFRQIAKSKNLEAIVTMMGRIWAKKYRMFNMGFIASPFVFSLIIKKLNPAIPDELLFDEKRWHLMWIDSDDL